MDGSGAIGYFVGGSTVRWLGGYHAAAQDLLVGAQMKVLRQDVKTYAVNAEVVHGAILEFDLGQFLDYVGKPDSIALAKLTLDAPEAAAPLPAPIAVSNITPSGGKIFFTGFVAGKGYELWATDGTRAGTYLVKDIVPGATSSYPHNLIDLGGKLYFMASQGLNKTDLWVLF